MSLRMFLAIVLVIASPVTRTYSDSPVASQVDVPADEPELAVGIYIDAPSVADVGELVRFDASKSNVEGMRWSIKPETPDFETIEQGRRAFFSAREHDAGRTFLITIAGAKGGAAFLQHHTIEIAGGGGGSNGRSLTSRVRSWVSKVPEYESRAEHVLAVSQVFRKLADAEDVDVGRMLESTATANSAVLGDDLEKWLPFLETLGAELDRMVSEGELSTREQYRDAWLAIADGLAVC